MLKVIQSRFLHVVFAALALFSVGGPVQYAHAVVNGCESLEQQLAAAEAQLAALQAERQSTQNAYASAITSCINFEGDAYQFCFEAVNSYFWPLIAAIDQAILNQNTLIENLKNQLALCRAGEVAEEIGTIGRGFIRGLIH